MRYAVPLSPFCRDQVRVSCDSDNPTAAEIAATLQRRAEHFDAVLTGPQSACLFADQRANLIAWRAECLRGAARAQVAA